MQGAKLEIESVLRETCDRVLSPEPPIPQQKLVLRATALDIMGEAFMAVQKESTGAGPLEGGYVHVQTKPRDSASYSK